LYVSTITKVIPSQVRVFFRGDSCPWWRKTALGPQWKSSQRMEWNWKSENG